MIRKHLLVLAFFSSSCVFGGGSEKNPNNSANNVADAENNANNVTDMGPDATTPPDDMTVPPDDMTVPPGDMTMPPDMTLPPDMMGHTYAEMTPTQQNCTGTPATAWFRPDPMTNSVRITQNSYVTTGGAPFDAAAAATLNGSTASVAFATEDGSNISVYAAAVGAPDDANQYPAVVEAATNIDTSADLLGISLFVRTVNRTSEPEVELFALLIATSEGVYDCIATIDVNDATSMTCAPSPWNATVASFGLQQPTRVDPAPIFEEIDNGDFGLDLRGFDLYSVVSGPTANGGESLGLLRSRRSGSVEQIQLMDVDTTLPSGTFGERLAFGVTDDSFGFPILLMLHDDPMMGLTPIALRSNNLSGTVYAPYTLGGRWELSRRLMPERGTFTFVDRYDINAQIWTVFVLFPIGIRFPPGNLQMAYAGITADNQGIIFSRPGGFAGNDFLGFQLPDSLEIAAFKNVPIQPASTGRSPIAVIHGANRDKLAVFNWGLELDATYVDDLLAPEFVNAQRMAPNWWTDDAGTISMLAQRNTEWVVAAVGIEDLTNLSTACE